ncbi:MAG: TraB/GumN family protein, partial [Syntrophales bacterium LBB04]|nr:TraB/GumN family protein [Syntrophales bacterium LBB04]
MWEKPLRMLWRLERKGRTSSIVGAAHFFKYSFKRRFAAEMKDAKAILFEGPLDAESMEKVADYGLDGRGTPSVVDAVTSEAAKEINRRLARLTDGHASTGLALIRSAKQNFLETNVRGARPWMAFFTIWSAYVKAKGWRHSMDMEAYQVARRLGRHIFFLETIDEQLRALDGIPFEGIIDYLNKVELWDQYTDRFVKFYLQGNLSDMLSYALRFPTRCESIIDDRDPVLFERMKPFVEEGGTLAFVGTTHVAGILMRFQAEGYAVRQE